MLKKATLQQLQHLQQQVRHAGSSAKKPPISQKVRFIDQLRVTVRGGHGGGGSSALFGRTGHHPRAAGGHGAAGGSVILRATKQLTGLGTVPLHIEAERGGSGGKQWMNGRRGADKIVPVPLGTLVYELVQVVDQEGLSTPHGVTALPQQATALIAAAPTLRPGDTYVRARPSHEQQQQQQPDASSAAVLGYPIIIKSAARSFSLVKWRAGQTPSVKTADIHAVQEPHTEQQEGHAQPSQWLSRDQQHGSKLLDRPRRLLFVDGQLQAAQQHKRASEIVQHQQPSDHVHNAIARAGQAVKHSCNAPSPVVPEDAPDTANEHLVRSQRVLTHSDKLHLLKAGSLPDTSSLRQNASTASFTGASAVDALHVSVGSQASKSASSGWASSSGEPSGTQYPKDSLLNCSSEDDDSGHLGRDTWVSAEDMQPRRHFSRHFSKQQVWSGLESQAVLLGDLEHDGQELVVALGGPGGRGNTAAARKHSRPASRSRSNGRPGQEVLLLLKLRLLADVVLVGMPNVGKSSLVAALTNARAQVGSYAFTTLRPQLGTLTDSKVFQTANSQDHFRDEREQTHHDMSAAASSSFPDIVVAATGAAAAKAGTHSDSSRSSRLVLADLPGLVPGAHAGKGRGTSFLAHIQKARCIAVVIDMTGSVQTAPLLTQLPRDCHSSKEKEEAAACRAMVPFTPTQQLAIIQEELVKYDVKVLKVPMLLVANKMDALASAVGAETLHELKQVTSLPIIPVSAKREIGLHRLKDALQLLVYEGQLSRRAAGVPRG